MSENENKDPKDGPLVQAIPMGDFPEAPVSANVKLFSENGADILFTVRSGASQNECKQVLDTLVGLVKYASEEYTLSTSRPTPPQHSPAVYTGTPAAPTPAVVGTPPPTAAAAPPPIAGNAPGITTMTFQTEKLVGEWMQKDGGQKLYWKVAGPPFNRHGIRIWEDVLEDAGFDLEGLSTRLEWELKGYTAHYVETPKKKVTKLVPNA